MKKSLPNSGMGSSTSKRMAAVRRSGTGPELTLRKILDGLKVVYRASERDLPGTPDLFLVEQRIPIFVHGCFWHRHAQCPKSTVPKTNREYWESKFLANVKRDKRVVQELRCSGFKPLVVWQCETVDVPKLTKRIKRRLLRSN